MNLEKFLGGFIDSFEFAKLAYQEAASLTNEEYFKLSGSAKQLIEEILPIALLAQHLRTPELHVDIRWFNDSEARDGKIRLQGKPVDIGFYQAEYFVEVTTAVSPKDYLQREALYEDGIVYGGDTIHRHGKRGSPIISEPEVLEGKATVIRATNWIIDCVRAKASKTYPNPCILIVNVKPEKSLSILDWAYIFETIQTDVIESDFESIYAIDVYHSTVVLLPKHPRKG